MTRREFRISAVPVILLGFIIFLGACATVPKEGDPVQQLRADAERYWQLRLQDKYDDTYKMEDKEGLPSVDDYRAKAAAMKRIAIKSISVKNATAKGDNGEVDLMWSYMLPNIPKPFHQIIKDRWIMRDGEWLHLFQ
jgi:hypothetical protein